MTPVLVLNTSFEPINVTTVQRAVRMILKGKATMEETDGRYLHSGRSQMAVPTVVRLASYRRIPEYQYTLSRKNILMRDRQTCQYCGRKLPAYELTLDHVNPRSQGGVSAWDNLVACCKPCNNHKGNRTPEQASMPLLAKPQPAGIHTNRAMLRLAGQARADWRKYLFY